MVNNKLMAFTGYLPYDLKVYTGRSVSPACTILKIGTSDGTIGISDDYKPILYPYYDIYNTIIFNGEKFCPIIELAKFQHPDANWETHAGFARHGEYWFGYVDGSFSFFKDKETCYVIDQVDMFDCLYKWKIDFRHTIELGWSCSVYDLPENPYI